MATCKEKFDLAIQKLIQTTKGKNSKFLTPETYAKLIQEVKDAKAKKTKKTTKDYRRLAKYAVVEIDGVEKLIVPLKGESQPRFYVHTGGLYEACAEVHEATGHGGRDKMKYDSKEGKYVNLSQKMLLCFKENCEQCLLKESTVKKGITVRPIIHKEMNARAQVDLIDMQTSADGKYRFIMVLQDHLTKFVHLRALTRKEAQQVATELVPIFLEFGAPSILQSDNGREFANAIINSLQEMWPELKIVHGELCSKNVFPHSTLQLLILLIFRNTTAFAEPGERGESESGHTGHTDNVDEGPQHNQLVYGPEVCGEHEKQAPPSGHRPFAL